MQRRWTHYAIAFLCSIITTTAQITLSFAPNTGMDASSFPIVTAQIRAVENGNPYIFTITTVAILEGQLIAPIKSVSVPNSNGFQTIVWESTLASAATIHVWSSNGAGQINARYRNLPQTILPNIVFENPFGSVKDNVYFGEVIPGRDTAQQIYIYLFSNATDPLDPLRTLPVRIDSVTTSSPEFRPRWAGAPGYTEPLPITTESSLRYRIAVNFLANDNRPYREYLTVHFNGGMKTSIQLTAGILELPPVSVLQLVEPLLAQTFIPCSQQRIRWTGAIPGSLVIVEYSSDGGENWENIDNIYTDSSTVWTVPDINTNNLVIRVRQSISRNDQTRLIDGNNRTAFKLAYSSNGNKLLCAYGDGEIKEWDIQSSPPKVIQSFFTTGTGGNTVRDTVYGLGYTQSGNIFATFRGQNSTSPDIFTLFTSGTPSPTLRVVLSQRFRSVTIDTLRTTLIAVPFYDTKLSLISTTSGALVQTLPLDGIIAAFGVYGSRAAVAYLDGRIQIRSTINWQLIHNLSAQRGLFTITQIAPLADQDRLAFTTSYGAVSVYPKSVGQFVLDIPTNRVLRTRKSGGSDAINITSNPTGRFIIMGFPYYPQILLWNLLSANGDVNAVGGVADQCFDVQFSPDGRTFASAAKMTNNDNLLINRFIFPEQSSTKQILRIVRPTAQTASLVIDPTYMFWQTDTLATAQLCNTSTEPLPLQNIRFESENNSFFSFFLPPSPDTLLPGACIRFPIRFAPSDTGVFRNSIKAQYCTQTYTINVESRGLGRNLSSLDTIDVGDVCVGLEKDITLNVLKNSDPVPLTINKVSAVNSGTGSYFTFLAPDRDVTLMSGDSLQVTVRFSPTQSGLLTQTAVVAYGGQTRYNKTFVIRGRGAGTDLQPNASPLQFLPDVRNRPLVLKNTNRNNLRITSVSLRPVAGGTTQQFILRNIPPLPFTVVPGDSVILSIDWNGTDSVNAEVSIISEPCNSPQNILLSFYRGSSTITIPTAIADPNSNTSIAINFQNQESAPFNGVRPFKAEFSVDYRLFFPLSVVSSYGTGRITRNQVIDDLRYVAIEVNGNFPRAGTAAEVIGAAGLADTNRSVIAPQQSAPWWGNWVTTTSKSGLLEITSTCTDRRIIRPNTLRIQTVAPQPASEFVHIIFESSEQADIAFDVFDQRGNSIVATKQLHLEQGTTEITVVTSSLAPGTYILKATSGGMSAGGTLLIVR